MQGFTARLRRAPPRTPGLRTSFRGAGASAFPRTPLAAGGKERVAWLPLPLCVNAACVQRLPYAYGSRFTRGLIARVHSVFFLTGKKKTSLAPCALGGDRLAICVCGQKPIETVFAFPLTGGGRLIFPAATVSDKSDKASVFCRRSAWASTYFIFHLSSFIIVGRSRPNNFAKKPHRTPCIGLLKTRFRSILQVYIMVWDVCVHKYRIFFRKGIQV